VDDSTQDARNRPGSPVTGASLRILARLGFVTTHTADDVHGLPTVFLRRVTHDTGRAVDAA
jgi:hypothetical protein